MTKFYTYEVLCQIWHQHCCGNKFGNVEPVHHHLDGLTWPSGMAWEWGEYALQTPQHFTDPYGIGAAHLSVAAAERV